MLMQRTVYEECFVLKWVSWVPTKCMIMVWRAEMDRIPTKAALVKRNIGITDTRCPWCNCYEETVMHVLSDCLIATNVWDEIGRWCRLDPIYAFEIKDLLEVYKSMNGSKKGKKIVHGIVIVTMWSMWKARNDSIFNGKRPNVENIVASVKSITFLWAKVD
ncbi:uncharacterized protein LOC110906995 [Helianthus annuus]|uniref:uncharacterized protein LOC110906995 n=1 Tax=Helianthus annuus TaxID=4232 RepID=UPI000B8F1EB9|nr:uncharacterized protein LOC110906995 [Helianthus annuus]